MSTDQEPEDVTERIQGRYNLYLIREAVRAGLTEADEINEFTTWLGRTAAAQRTLATITIDEHAREMKTEFRNTFRNLLDRLTRRRST